MCDTTFPQSAFRLTARRGGNLFSHAGHGSLGTWLWLLSLLLLLCVPSAFATQVTLKWDAVTVPQLAGYKVYYGHASRQYSVNLNAGTSTAAAISSLKDAQAYYFAVTAYDTSGKESGYSNEVSYDLGKVDTDKDGLYDWDELNFYKSDPTGQTPTGMASATAMK